uniref:Piwi domain-containing protein n=1 Tax=Panagrolaimus davidi TaxID=227884 RepID=A0A914P9K2_9BILA
MKLSVSFLLFVSVFQFGSSNVLSKRGTQEQLLSDANAVQNGSNVIMAKPGPLDVILNGDELVFEVCSLECYGDFLVFYESDPSGFQNVLDSCTPPPTTIGQLGQLDPTSSGKNGHVSASTAESGSFFADNWWIFLILGIILNAIGILIGIGVGVYCYLRRKKNAQKPVPIRRRKFQGSKSPVVLQASTEKQNGRTESAQKGRSGKRKVNAIINTETTTARPTTTTLGQHDRTSSGKNGHASAAATDEPGSFFADYWRIFSTSVFIIIAFGVGVGHQLKHNKEKHRKCCTARFTFSTDGEIEKIRAEECGFMMNELTADMNGKTPKLTVIAVRPPQQNVTSGTCVPGATESDTLMVQHRALQGTAKPTIFTSSSDADLTPHFLKNITHAFCYMNEIVDSAISIPHTLRSAEQMANRC